MLLRGCFYFYAQQVIAFAFRVGIKCRCLALGTVVAGHIFNYLLVQRFNRNIRRVFIIHADNRGGKKTMTHPIFIIELTSFFAVGGR